MIEYLINIFKKDSKPKDYKYCLRHGVIEVDRGTEYCPRCHDVLDPKFVS